jgi:putative membrane protein
MKALTNAAKKHIAEATQAAEKSTSGEIVCAVIPESSTYAFYELMFGVFLASVSYLTAMFFFTEITAWVSTIFWAPASWITTAFIGTGSFVIGSLGYLIANIPGFDRLIVPKSKITEAVRNRAYLHFIDSGLTATRDRTGVLIFVSLNEHRVELVADSGINEKVDQESWNQIVSDLIEKVKENDLEKGLVGAVTAVGNRLTEHFPIKSDDTNELSNDVQELDS